MPGRKRVWVVVSDAARARCLEVTSDERLALVADGEFANTELGRHARDLRSDSPGRSFSSGAASTRSAIEPRRDYRKLEKRKFAQKVGRFLDRAVTDDRFDVCVLVAPPRTMGELREALSATVKTRIGKEVQKDLTAWSNDELWKNLQADIRKIARPLPQATRS